MPTTPTILIVDDEREVIEITSNILTKRGYQVICCANAEDAFPTAQKSPIHLLITDYRLPGQNGDVLVHKLKSDPATRHIPVLMCTAQATLKSPTGGNPRLRKPDDYLIKPFEINTLLEKVTRLIA